MGQLGQGWTGPEQRHARTPTRTAGVTFLRTLPPSTCNAPAHAPVFCRGRERLTLKERRYVSLCSRPLTMSSASLTTNMTDPSTSSSSGPRWKNIVVIGGESASPQAPRRLPVPTRTDPSVRRRPLGRQRPRAPPPLRVPHPARRAQRVCAPQPLCCALPRPPGMGHDQLYRARAPGNHLPRRQPPPRAGAQPRRQAPPHERLARAAVRGRRRGRV